MVGGCVNKLFRCMVFLSVALNFVFLTWMLQREQSAQPHLMVSTKDLYIGSNRDTEEGKEYLHIPLKTTPTDPCSLYGNTSMTTKKDLNRFNRTLRSFIPPPHEFEKSFSNPCWFMELRLSSKAKRMFHHKGASLSDEDANSLLAEIFGQNIGEVRSDVIPKALYCIPKVYFIGFPKSGSTQLYKMLMEHPLLVGGLNKEPHWWTKFNFIDKFPKNLLGVMRYLVHYGDASEYIQKNPQAMAIDGSQSTIWDTRTFSNLCALPATLSSIVPDAKYIVIMREPVGRLYSDFAYLCEEYWEAHKVKGIPSEYLANAPDMFHGAVQAEISSFEHCLEKASLHVCTHYALQGKESSSEHGCGRVRLGISLYYAHITRWLRSVPLDQFLFLRTEDLAHNPYKLLQDVWRFLGIPQQPASDLRNVLFEHFNTNEVSHVKSVQMLNKTRQALHQFFDPFNQKLADLLGSNSFLWEDS